MKLKLKETIYIFTDGEEYKVFFTGIRKVKSYKVNNLVKTIIKELKEPKNKEEILTRLKEYPKQEIESCISALEREGILRLYKENSPERFDRQKLFLDELTSSRQETKDLQNKLENSKISVFGVGGIGSWIVNGLSQIGIGQINISDPDKISESNLNRQLFFSQKDIGKYKTDVLKEKLPDTNVKSFKKMVSPSESLEDVVEDSNLIINCADFPSVHETTRVIGTYAEKNNIDYCVAGGYNMHLGMVGPIFIPGKTASFDDYISFQKRNDPFLGLKMIKEVEQTGSLGPLAGAVANIQVMEILKHLIQKGNLNYDHYAEIDFLNNETNWINFSKDSKKI